MHPHQTWENAGALHRQIIMKHLLRRACRLIPPLLVLGLLHGCAVVGAAVSVAGTAVSVAGTVVSTTVAVTGKVIEKTVDVATSTDEVQP